MIVAAGIAMCNPSFEESKVVKHVFNINNKSLLLRIKIMNRKFVNSEHISIFK